MDGSGAGASLGSSSGGGRSQIREVSGDVTSGTYPAGAG